MNNPELIASVQQKLSKWYLRRQIKRLNNLVRFITYKFSDIESEEDFFKAMDENAVFMSNLIQAERCMKGMLDELHGAE